MKCTKATADVSKCGKYRYRLTREWAERPRLGIVMLNPSTANAAQDDPTIRKCVGFATRHGYGSIDVVNLFAFRATAPADLQRAWDYGTDVVGRENDHAIASVSRAADAVLAAWGAHGAKWPGRAGVVLKTLVDSGKPVYCLGRTKDGSPRHPLMVAYQTPMTELRIIGGDT